MTKANCRADSSPRNQRRRRRAAIGGWASGVRGSDLALGVGDTLDQVVAADVRGDLAGQALLDLDVELVGPWEVPRLIDRGAELGYVGRLLPDLQDLRHVAPRRPAGLDDVAVHHRL